MYFEPKPIDAPAAQPPAAGSPPPQPAMVVTHEAFPVGQYVQRSEKEWWQGAAIISWIAGGLLGFALLFTGAECAQTKVELEKKTGVRR